MSQSTRKIIRGLTPHLSNRATTLLSSALFLLGHMEAGYTLPLEEPEFPWDMSRRSGEISKPESDMIVVLGMLFTVLYGVNVAVRAGHHIYDRYLNPAPDVVPDVEPTLKPTMIDRLINIKVDSGLDDYPEAKRSFVCPITKEIMTDPVVIDDGQSYERKALQAWMKESYLCPFDTSKEITMIVPNTNLKAQITEFVEKLEAEKKEAVKPENLSPARQLAL